MPAKMPIGVEISVDRPTSSRLPVMALIRPPPSLRDAGAVHHQALAVDGIHWSLAHYLTPSLRDIPANISLAADRTIKVITNRISASAYSDDTCNGVSASANSLARVEAIELPAENSDHDSELALPMTKVTAIVSPSARPRPSMTPPTTPVLV